MLKIKICGLTRAADVDAAVAAGADLVGFNLACGPRRISLSRAIPLARRVPPGVAVVALFVDAAEPEILAAASALRCCTVQLAGDETPDLCERLGRRLRVIKTFRIGCAADLDAVDGHPADAYLLDAKVAGLRGGTGAAFDHRLLAGRRFARPLVLAGGLGPANVAAAVRAVHPWAVDAASGVESAPGLKDAARMRAFVRAARAPAGG